MINQSSQNPNEDEEPKTIKDSQSINSKDVNKLESAQEE